MSVSASQATSSSPSLCRQVACLPCNLISSAFYWVCQKIHAIFQKFIGSFVRIGVFMFGEYNQGCVPRTVIELFKKGPCDIRNRPPFDPERLRKSIHILERLGGERHFITPSDKQAKIEYMLLTYQKMREQIEAHGCRIIENMSVTLKPSKFKFPIYLSSEEKTGMLIDVIVSDPSKELSDWDTFREQTLCKMGWKKATVEIDNVPTPALVLWEREEENNCNIQDQTPCILRSHSPTESYAMERTYIGRHLGVGCDVCVYDYRCTWESRGKEPSEGGYYLDAKAVYKRLKNTHGYEPTEIWASGYCLGGAVSASLKQRYHEEGINYIGENTFASLEETIDNQMWPARALGNFAIDAICSKDRAITSRVEQDHFNTARKFWRLKKSENAGISLILNTDNDKTLAQDTHGRLVRSAKNCGRVFGFLRNHPLSHKDGHGEDPNDDPLLWKQYVQILHRGKEYFNSNH